MNILRWLLCIPMAFLSALFLWIGFIKVYGKASYGPNLLDDIIGLLPLFLRTTLVGASFVVIATVICPCRKYWPIWVFTVIGALFSPGGFDILRYNENSLGEVKYWLAAALGQLAGVGVGAIVSLVLVRKWRRTSRIE